MIDVSPHWLALGVSLLLFLSLWPLSVVRRDTSVVDVAWGPGFAFIAFTLWIWNGLAHEQWRDDWRSLLLLALTTVWAGRLGAHMLARKIREPEEDPRYSDLRIAWAPGFWWKSLFVVFALQALIQWSLTLGVQRALISPPIPFYWWNALAAIIAIAGLAIETAADAQLSRHRRLAPRDAVCDSGLWAWCRHPNYFGELVFWWGLWGVAAPAAEFWTILAPITLTLLLRYVSGVPMLEEHLSRAKRDYAGYRARTPMLWPRPPSQRQALKAAR